MLLDDAFVRRWATDASIDESTQLNVAVAAGYTTPCAPSEDSEASEAEGGLRRAHAHKVRRARFTVVVTSSSSAARQ